MAGSADSASRQKVLARLMKRTAQADWQAFGMLYSMTSPQLFGLMLSMTDYANTCEDLLQEVYLTVWKKAGDYQPEKARVTTWLSTIARNRTLDWLRSQAASTAKEGSQQSPQAVELSAGSAGPEQWADLSGQNVTLQSCLDNLSAEQRRAIVLAYFNGHTHAELAKVLNSALGTVKSWVRRGLENLRTCLQAAGGEA